MFIFENTKYYRKAESTWFETASYQICFPKFNGADTPNKVFQYQLEGLQTTEVTQGPFIQQFIYLLFSIPLVNFK